MALIGVMLTAGCGRTAHQAASSLPRSTPSTSATTPTTTAATSTLSQSTSQTSPPTSTQPRVEVAVYGDCQEPRVRPSEIILPCADHGVGVSHIAWKSWTATDAIGIGTLYYNDCTPNCAEGHFHHVPNTVITLSVPVHDPHGRLVFSRSQEDPLPPGWGTGPLHGAPFPLVTQPT